MTWPHRVRCFTLTAQVPRTRLHIDELLSIATLLLPSGGSGPSLSFLPETPLLPTQVLAQHHFMVVILSLAFGMRSPNLPSFL